MPPYRTASNTTRNPPEHWNAYRPIYHDRGRRDSNEERRASRPRSKTPLLTSSSANPNRIPLPSRSPTKSKTSTPPPPPRTTARTAFSPPLWSTALDSLMCRTARAYDLVVNYERDCPHGHRWDGAGIRAVRETGKELHAKISVLRHWQRHAGVYGGLSEEDLAVVKSDVEDVERLCEDVNAVISGNEFELAERLGRIRELEDAERMH